MTHTTTSSRVVETQGANAAEGGFEVMPAGA